MNEEGKEKDEILGSIENLSISGSSSGFKRKPVIVIVVGMAGMLSFLKYFMLNFLSVKSLNMCDAMQGVGRLPLCIG